jgi:hypothetical protein
MADPSKSQRILSVLFGVTVFAIVGIIISNLHSRQYVLIGACITILISLAVIFWTISSSRKKP